MALAPVFVTLSSIAGILGVSIGAVAGPVALVAGGVIAASAYHCWIDYLDAKFMAKPMKGLEIALRM